MIQQIGSSDQCIFEADEDPENPLYKSYVPPDVLISWIKWHGPYNTFEEWVSAAKDYSDRQGVRLYMALGRCQRFSLRKPEIQYIGLNSRDGWKKDARFPLHREIKSKSNKNSAARKKLFGFFNEYWVGELLSDWERVPKPITENGECRATLEQIDTPKHGLTKNSEYALIFALNPTQNFEDHDKEPAYSFRIINEICEDVGHNRRRLFKRFKKLVPGYIEFDKRKSVMRTGHFSITQSQEINVSELLEQRASYEQKRSKKLRLKWWRQLFEGHSNDVQPSGVTRDYTRPKR